jgi:hypothetical protein
MTGFGIFGLLYRLSKSLCIHAAATSSVASLGGFKLKRMLKSAAKEWTLKIVSG